MSKLAILINKNTPVTYSDRIVCCSKEEHPPREEWTTIPKPSRRTRTNTNPNDTEANAAGRGRATHTVIELSLAIQIKSSPCLSVLGACVRSIQLGPEVYGEQGYYIPLSSCLLVLVLSPVSRAPEFLSAFFGRACSPSLYQTESLHPPCTSKKKVETACMHYALP